MSPTVQLTVTLTPGLDGWVESRRDAPPILVIGTNDTEVCLVLASDHVTVNDVHATRRLAELVTTFATHVAARAS